MENHRIYIKFWVKNKIKCSDIVEMLQKAFGESSMHVNELFTNSTNAFKEVVNLLKMIMELDDHAHQQKLMKRWKKLRKKSMANSRNTIREVAEKVGISYGSCEAIFTDTLGMKRVAANCSKIVGFSTITVITE